MQQPPVSGSSGDGGDDGLLVVQGSSFVAHRRALHICALVAPGGQSSAKNVPHPPPQGRTMLAGVQKRHGSALLRLSKHRRRAGELPTSRGTPSAGSSLRAASCSSTGLFVTLTPSFAADRHARLPLCISPSCRLGPSCLDCRFDEFFRVKASRVGRSRPQVGSETREGTERPCMALAASLVF